METFKTTFTKGTSVEVQIRGLNSKGEGVGKVDGFTIFVPEALPEEKVVVRLTLVKKNYARGTLVSVKTPAKERIKPRCKVYAECGGCQVQHLSYAGQLTVKRQQVVDALERLGHFAQPLVKSVIGAQQPWHYRNKMQVPVARAGRGALAIGCFAQGTHKVIDVGECFIQKEANNKIAQIVRQWMKLYKIPPLDEDAGTGIVRHVMGRVGVSTGEVMAVLICRTAQVPHIKDLGKMLQDAIPNFKTLVLNINSRHTNVIMGEKSRLVLGEGFIRDELCGLSFNISAQSFYQVNSEQAQKLYQVAVDYAALTGKENIIDVYCGTGTITLCLARRARIAYGIEIVAEAIADAKQNARNNKIRNAHFLVGDAALELPKLLSEGVRPDVIVVDPPRAGCDERVLKAMAQVGPKRIVYVSCNPASLARDAAILCAEGYSLAEVQPVDMFPQTHHVESVALLCKVKAQNKAKG